MKANDNNRYFSDMTKARARDYDKTRRKMELESLMKQANPSELTRRKIAVLERELEN